MFKAIIGGLVGALAFSSTAFATCTAPSNDTTADAAALNTYLNCEFASLVGPSFSGNVGIDTTSPSQALTVHGAILADGNLAVGNAASVSTGNLVDLNTNVSGDLSGLTYNDLYDASTYTNTGSGTAPNISGLVLSPTVASGSTGPVNLFRGGYFGATYTGSGSANLVAGTVAYALNYSGGGTQTNVDGVDAGVESDRGTVTNLNGIYARNFSYGGTITNASGLYVDTPAYSSDTVTNNYGFYIASQVSSGSSQPTNNYQFYSNGTAPTVITTAGSVGIGTTTPATALAVVGDIRVGTSGSNGCVQDFAGTALTGTCSSDARLKTVVANVSGVLDKLSHLQLVTFHWNDKAAALYHNSTTALNTGFLAQAVEQQFPELVTMDKLGYRQLDYSTLSLYSIEAIRELKADNDRQTAEIRDQDAEIAALKSQLGSDNARLAKLEARTAFLQSDTGGKPTRRTAAVAGERP